MSANLRYYIVDTETSGVSADDGVCEIAYMEVDEGFNVIDQGQSLIDPECRIAHGASGIHGIVNEDVKDSPTLEEYFTSQHPACRGKPFEGPCVVIGHKVDFDLRFLKPYVQDVQHSLCTLRWVRKLYPEAENHKLQTLVFLLGLPRSEGAHRAMADVLTTKYLTQHLLSRTGMSLPELAAASSAPMRVEMMPLGKHKGKKMCHVPRSYLSWMRREFKDLDADMSFTLNLLLN